MKFDDILVRIGEFGYFQRRLYLLLCMPSVVTGCYMMILVFVMEPPKHRCKIPEWGNDTYAIQSEEHRKWINYTIPPSTDDQHTYDQCHYYAWSENYTSFANRTVQKCTEWVYDKTVFLETFTSRHNLVCGESIKTSIAEMVFYFGVLVGDISFGLLSDVIGRKKTFTISVIILLASSTATVFAPEFYSFCVLEFINGAAVHGAFMVCCVLGLEMVGPSKRVWAGIPIHMFFAVGLVYLAGMEYFTRDWQYVQIAITAPVTFFLLYWWLITESPRWLTSQGRYEEANAIISKAAKANNVDMQGEKLVDLSTLDAPKQGNILELFKYKVLFFRTMILFFNWIVISMVYYGVTMHTGNLGGNFYLNFFILAVVEFPAKAMTMVLLNRIGRKKMHCTCMMIGGIACLSTIFTVVYGGDSLQPVTLTLAIIGKFGSAAAFGVIYIYSLELYPTVVRNGGMGMSSCVARVGGMVAPYVAKSGDLVGGRFGQALPLVIFGGCSVLAGIFTLFLPETHNRKLPETIQDGKEFGRKPRGASTANLVISSETINSIMDGKHHVTEEDLKSNKTE